MTPEDIKSLAGAATGSVVGLALGYLYWLKQEKKTRARAEWTWKLYQETKDWELRKRLFFTPVCELTPEEQLLLTPPAYRPKK